MSDFINSYYKCTCGHKIKYKSLRSHLKTQKHDILFRCLYGISNESIIKQMESLDLNKEKYTEGKYLEYCNILKDQWNYWSKENSTKRKWSYYRCEDNIYIDYRDNTNKFHSYKIEKIQ